MTQLADRYEVLGTLGEGSMGQVLLVKDATTGREMALKMLKAGVEGKRLQQEFWTMTRLRHPRTVEVFDYGSLPDGTPYFTMERVGGEELSRLVPMAADALPDLLAKVCDALGYIHAQGFVHGDLKPENLRLTEGGDLKLMDYGLMERSGRHTGAIRGTPYYVAPEVVRGGPVDQRADLYSLGAVAYHLLTGRPPFDGQTAVEIFKHHLHELPGPPSGLVPCPPALETVLLKLLAKDPLDRFQSAADVARALGREAYAGRPLILAPSFVGRDAELARLRELFNAAGAGAPGALITGDAGIGKSRLLGEFRVQIQLAEVAHASGSCHEQNEAPYGPWIQILRQLMPLARYHAPDLVDLHAGALAAILPELGAATPALEPKEEALRLEAAVADLVYSVAEATKALVIFLEDLHFLDARSADLLAFLLRSAGNRPLLVVATARPRAGQDPACFDLLEPLALGGLSQQDLALIVASALGGAQVPPSFLDATHRIAGGNPLFTEVLLRHLSESGALRVEDHRWVVAADPVAEDVPAELRELLTSRFSRLPEDASRLAALLAVAGREVPLELLCEVWDGSPDEFFAALETLRAEGILSCDQGVFGFAHATAGEVLRAALPEDRRRAWHGRLAEALDMVLDAGDPDRALVLAHHFLESGEPARALRFCLQAGRRAAELFANEQARHVLSAGLALLGKKPKKQDEATRLEMLALLADVGRLAGDLERAAEAGAEAADLARKVGDAVLQARAEIGLGRVEQIRGDLDAARQHLETGRDLAGPDDPALQCRALASLGRIAYLGQDIKGAIAHYQQLLDVARAAELRSQAAEGLAFLGFAYATTDHARLEEGLDLLHESLEIRQQLGDRLGLLDTYMLLGNAYLALGHYPEARDCFAQCQHLAYIVGHKDEEVFSRLNLAVVALEMGDFLAGADLATQAEIGTTVTGSKYTRAMAQAIRGVAELYVGKLAAGFGDFEAACEIAQGLEHPYLDIVVGAYHSDFLHMVGSAEAARLKARKALEKLEASGNAEMLPAALTLLALIDVALGDLKEASSLLERARDHAVAARSKGGQAKALRGLALLGVAAGKFEAARDDALEGLRLAEEVGADYLMGELNCLLGDACHGLGQNGHAIVAYRAALTIAEQKGTPDLAARAHLGLSQAEPTRAGHHMGSARERVVALLEGMPEDEREAFKSRWDKDLLAAAGPARRQEGPALDQRLSRLQRDINDFAVDFRKQQREHQDLQVSQRRLQQLIDFSLTVNSIHDLKEVLDKALDLILAITGAERGFLLIFDDGVLRCQTYRNLYPEGRTAMDYQISRTIAEEVLRTEQPLCLVDAMSDDRFKNYESIQALQLRTVICVPLKIRDAVVGAVYVDRQTINDEFSESDLDLVLSLAALASNAIENANLHGEWTDKSRKLAMLNDLARTITTTLVMDEVLDLVVQMTLEVTKAERGFLLLWEAERLACKSAMDKNGARLGDQTISMSICQTVLETSQPVCVTNAMGDEQLQLKQSIMLMSLKTIMAVPLLAKGTLLGVLYVDSQAIVNTFTGRDLELLEAIASHAAVAIENAQLYQQLTKRAQELQRTVQLYEEANMRAATDVLTGLYNRRYFQEELARDFAAARRHRRDLSVLMVDIDHFKSFNDTYGHHVGDAVLVAVSQVLMGAVRLADAVARYGGEEFIINLPDTDLKGAIVVAERIRKGVQELKFEEGIRPITVSVGVASIQAQDERIAELIERADQALFSAKAKGRDRVEAPEETEV
ncbi:MAG: diguanylate cyclase [Candidatus Sericytochromatia bacterium]|nr:diguanylate cyclase [Candidatus Tanganyikabacteria bacterium]